jgi:glycosyltransferase involved in cell wall biosynthesis
MGKREHDVAIYSPASSAFFGGETRVATETGMRKGEEGVATGGGAELQMSILARGLATMGVSVALITWPVGRPIPGRGPQPDLVNRPSYAGDSGRFGRLAEAVHIWRAMGAADAACYVFRGGGPPVFVGAVFCRLHRRKLVFSAASDLDFDFERPDRTSSQVRQSRLAIGRADLIVAQREQQAELVRAAGFGPLVTIPSFAEPADVARERPEAFLWIGRLVDYKRPMEYVRLAKSLPEARFRMVWFATDETRPGQVEELKDKAASVNNLELINRLPRPELLDLIGGATALVSTSNAEGMPNTFLEAWARGVPVISLDYDPDGRISSQGLGLVAHSEQDLREATAALAGDEKQRDQLGERARNQVRELHSPEAVTRRWSEALAELQRG